MSIPSRTRSSLIVNSSVARSKKWDAFLNSECSSLKNATSPGDFPIDSASWGWCCCCCCDVDVVEEDSFEAEFEVVFDEDAAGRELLRTTWLLLERDGWVDDLCCCFVFSPVLCPLFWWRLDAVVGLVMCGIESGESGWILSFPVSTGKELFPSSVGTREGNSFISFCNVLKRGDR